MKVDTRGRLSISSWTKINNNHHEKYCHSMPSASVGICNLIYNYQQSLHMSYMWDLGWYKRSSVFSIYSTQCASRHIYPSRIMCHVRCDLMTGNSPFNPHFDSPQMGGMLVSCDTYLVCVEEDIPSWHTIECEENNWSINGFTYSNY